MRMRLLEFYGKRVAKWRKSARLTQPQLAKKIGKTKQTVTALENATQGTTFDVMDDISKALNAPVAAFFPTFVLGEAVSDRDEKIDAIIAEARRLKDAHIDTVLEIIQCLGENTDHPD